MRKFVAFTLAETLIVIGVIGIVSALTLPNLNSSTGAQEKVAQVKKIHQNLNDAFGRAEAVYGPYDEWIRSSDDSSAKMSKRIAERMTEFMKISKNCDTTKSGCFSSSDASYLNSKGSDSKSLGKLSESKDKYRIITADGTSVSFYRDKHGNNEILVDIDGPNKGSNTLGKDIFEFTIDDNLGIVPARFDESFSDLMLYSYIGDGAAAWILRYDNADYLKLKDKSGICDNGNMITEANPRCK